MNFFVFMAEAFAEGAVIMPNIVFASLFFNHFGEYQYIMPFVLLYAFEKAGTFAIQGFGRINNPYKILKIAILIAVLGSYITLFSYINPIFWSIGASLIGIGLSVYIPFYKTVTDDLKNKNMWKYKNSSLKGYLYLALFMIVSIAFRKINIRYIFLLFAISLSFSAYFIFKLDISDNFRKNKMFIPHGLAFRYFLPTISIFILTFFTVALKQTSNLSYITYMLIAFCLLILTDFFYKKGKYKTQSIQSIWYGATRNFFTIYSLIYFTAIGKYSRVSLSYFMIALALLIAMFISPILKKKLSKSDFELVCILSTMISSVIVLLPNTYMAGVLLSCIFIAMGNSLALTSYLNDEDFVVYERRLVKARFYSLGSVLQQVFLLSVLLIVSKIFYSNFEFIISSYVFSSGNLSLEHVFLITRLICVIAIWISGFYILCKTFPKKIKNFKKYVIEKIEKK